MQWPWQRSAGDAGEEPLDPFAQPEEPERAPVPQVDLWVAALLCVGAACAAALLPDGDRLRLAATAPAWLVLPGYLLLQAVLLPVRSRGRRALHLVAGVGLSLAVVGLVALLTLSLPGGLAERTLVISITAFSLLCAIAAGVRRAHEARAQHGLPPDHEDDVVLRDGPRDTRPGAPVAPPVRASLRGRRRKRPSWTTSKA